MDPAWTGCFTTLDLHGDITCDLIRSAVALRPLCLRLHVTREQLNFLYLPNLVPSEITCNLHLNLSSESELDELGDQPEQIYELSIDEPLKQDLDLRLMTNLPGLWLHSSEYGDSLNSCILLPANHTLDALGLSCCLHAEQPLLSVTLLSLSEFKEPCASVNIST